MSGQPGDQCLLEFMVGDKNDKILLHLCSSYIITYGKVAVDKLLVFIKIKDEYIESNIEHTIELLTYIINTRESTTKSYSVLKPAIVKICEYQAMIKVAKSILNFITSIYSANEEQISWAIDNFGFDPLLQFITKSSFSNSISDIICLAISKDRITQILDMMVTRYYILLNNEFNKSILPLFEAENRQRFYSVLVSLLNTYAAAYPAVCCCIYSLCSTDDNKRWFMGAGVIEKLYSFHNIEGLTKKETDRLPSESPSPKGNFISAYGNHPHSTKLTVGSPKRAPFAFRLEEDDEEFENRFANEGVERERDREKEKKATSKNEESLISCINVTCKLAEIEETHKQLVEVGALVIIVHALKIENKNVTNVAAIALRTLAKMDDENEVALVQLGAIEVLLPLLKTRSEPFLQNIMGAFRCVCFLREHAEKMAKLGGVGYISEILSEAVDDMTLLHALGMIRNLIDFPDISVMIDEAGVVLILIQKLRAISQYGEIDNISMMLEIFSVCLTAEELAPMPSLLFVMHDCVPILLRLLAKHNSSCTSATFEILFHIVLDKELCHSIICPELNILFDDPEISHSDVADLLMELHNNASLQNKLCLFLLENCQLPTAYGLIEKYPTLDLFSERLTEFLTDNNYINVKRYVNSNNPQWIFCGTIALAILGQKSTWKNFENKMVKILFEVLTSANLVFTVPASGSKISTYRKYAAYAIGFMLDRLDEDTKPKQEKLPFTDNYESLLDNKQFSDVRFNFSDGEEPILAHRMLLAHRCEYFRDLFQGGFKEQREMDINVGEASREIFFALIKYIYTTTLKIPDVKFALELLQLAEMYRLSQLKEEIIDYVLTEIKDFYLNCTITHKPSSSPFLTLSKFNHFEPINKYTFADIEWITNVAHFADRIYHTRLLESCCKVLPEILVHIINTSSNVTVPQPEIESLNATMALVKQVLQKKLFRQKEKQDKNK